MSDDIKSTAIKYTVVKERSPRMNVHGLDEARLNATYKAGHGFIWDQDGDRRVVTRKMIASILDTFPMYRMLVAAGKGDNLPTLNFLWDECRPLLLHREVRLNPAPPNTDRDTNG